MIPSVTLRGLRAHPKIKHHRCLLLRAYVTHYANSSHGFSEDKIAEKHVSLKSRDVLSKCVCVCVCMRRSSFSCHVHVLPAIVSCWRVMGI